MKKKVLIINGSPRNNGNTSILADWVCEGLATTHAEIETVRIMAVENVAHGCMGCRKCNDSDEYRCALEDRTFKLIRKFAEKDVVVFASPVYFGSFTAQMKQLIDRMYCLKRYKEGEFTVWPALKNVAFVLLATAGADEQSGLDFFSEHMQRFAAGFGKEIKEFLVPLCPPDPKDMALRADVREKAIRFGGRIFE